MLPATFLSSLDITVAGAAVPMVVWVYLLLLRGGFWKFQAAKLPATLPGFPPRVAVIIPARDEEDVVGRAVASLCAQDYPGEFHVFVADDHSSDGTGRVALEAALASGREDLVSVVTANSLPAGWTGKVWALSEGLRQAREWHPDFVLFTDADIVHGTDSLTKLMSKALSDRLDLVSLMARLRCETVAEKLLIPAFVFFFFKLYPPAWIADPAHSAAGAAGGCILLRREALERAGGIERIHGAIIDDCALAAAVKRSGGKLFLGLADQTRSLRPYRTFVEIGRMISRTAFTQLNHSALLLMGTVLGMFLLYLMPPFLVATGSLSAAVLGGLAWALMTGCYTPALRFYRRSILWAPLLPMAGLFYTGATIHSAVQYWRGRGGAWKGRHQARSAN